MFHLSSQYPRTESSERADTTAVSRAAAEPRARRAAQRDATRLSIDLASPVRLRTPDWDCGLVRLVEMVRPITGMLNPTGTRSLQHGARCLHRCGRSLSKRRSVSSVACSRTSCTGLSDVPLFIPNHRRLQFPFSVPLAHAPQCARRIQYLRLESGSGLSP